MSESKMRAALESIAANTCCGSCQEAALVAREALAQPAEVVELTDEEITKVWNKTPDDDEGDVDIFAYARPVIAAHEAKKAGGGVCITNA